jgi:hypothetical protein
MTEPHKHIVFDGFNEKTGQDGVKAEEVCHCKIGHDHY